MHVWRSRRIHDANSPRMFWLLMLWICLNGGGQSKISEALLSIRLEHLPKSEPQISMTFRNGQSFESCVLLFRSMPRGSPEILEVPKSE